MSAADGCFGDGAIFNGSAPFDHIIDLDELGFAASLKINFTSSNLLVCWGYELPLHWCTPVGAQVVVRGLMGYLGS